MIRHSDSISFYQQTYTLRAVNCFKPNNGNAMLIDEKSVVTLFYYKNVVWVIL